MAIRDRTHFSHHVRPVPSFFLFQADWLPEPPSSSGIAHRHIIGVGAPRVPGEVNDPSGIGNDEFDAGKKVSKYGYPVKGMYRLPKPLTSAALKERYGISPPQGYMYAPEALVQGEPLNAMEVLY